MNINIFSDKEQAVIKLFAPELSVEEIISRVLRSWFDANAETLYKKIKPQEEKLDEIITAHAKEKGKPVIK